MAEQVWEFTFTVVMHGASKAEALEQAYLYLQEHAGQQALPPTKAERIE